MKKRTPAFSSKNVDAGKGDDMAFIYYTSGTTGLPKGAILTHRALITTASGFVNRYPMNEKDNLISNFPAAWVGDSFFATIPHLLTGARLNFPEEPETIAEDTREIGPELRYLRAAAVGGAGQRNTGENAGRRLAETLGL